jgi:hypothetical protein
MECILFVRVRTQEEDKNSSKVLWLLLNKGLFTNLGEEYMFHDLALHAGLCDPEKKLLELHQKESCSRSPTLASDD